MTRWRKKQQTLKKIKSNDWFWCGHSKWNCRNIRTQLLMMWSFMQKLQITPEFDLHQPIEITNPHHGFVSPPNTCVYLILSLLFDLKNQFRLEKQASINISDSKFRPVQSKSASKWIQNYQHTQIRTNTYKHLAHWNSSMAYCGQPSRHQDKWTTSGNL